MNKNIMRLEISTNTNDSLQMQKISSTNLLELDNFIVNIPAAIQYTTHMFTNGEVYNEANKRRMNF